MSDILKILKDNKQRLFQKYPIRSLALFGSFSRGDNNEKSDIDILVDFSEPVGTEFLDLCYDIESLLHRDVDLVSKRAIKPKYYQFIEEELQYV